MIIEAAGYITLALSGILSAILAYRGRGWSVSIVFLYLLSYQGMEILLKAIGRYQDLPYIAFALAINATFFYILLNKQRTRMALIIGFDTIFAGANIWLIQSEIFALDRIYGHVGIAVSLLLLADGVNRGFRHQHYADSDSWNIDLAGRLRHLLPSKRAKG